ncbi:sucrase/ferredoxin domain-containing protein [Diaporthe sp. PMI_573]|nr:sucrase/ferredoxin domain-containing protein [Diaporthaceae sp. PMI_573]
MSALHIIFRVIYDSFYVFLSLIVLLLLLVTPADNVRLALQNGQNLHVLTTVVCLSATLLFVVLLYFARLYVNRTALANIPKPWIPIGKGEVKKSVRKMIVASLSRSAAIAYESKPRVAPARPLTAMTDPEEMEEETKAEGNGRRSTLRVFKLKKAPTVEDKMGITLPPHRAVWGEIEHYGWSSPNSLDLPDLQYSTVISELPNLIEAKALTLAPPVAPGPTHADPPVLDPEAIGLLQRPDNLALRQYLTQLAELGVLAPSRTTADFLSAYEYARYSTRPISNARFRELMHLFAELLRAMQPLDPAVLVALLDDGGFSGDEESDIDDDAPRRSPPSTPRSRHSSLLSRQRSTASRATASTASSGRSAGSGGSYVRRRPNQQQQHPTRPQMEARVSSQGTTWGGAPTYRTAPTTPKTQKTAASPSSTSSSANSFAQTRRPYAGGSGSISTSSIASASVVARSRSGRSSVASGGSAGSVVIRLAGRGDGDAGGGLPYVLSLGGDSDR